MTIQEGRPENCTARAENELRVYDLLDSLGVSYLRADHEPAMTMEACGEISRALGADICKNLFLCNRQGTDFYLLMLPADKNFRTKDLSAQIGSARLSFAGPEQLERFLGVTPGSVSVLGLMNDADRRVRLLIDSDLLAAEYVGCHPCRNTSSLRIRITDLMEKILPALGHTATVVRL